MSKRQENTPTGEQPEQTSEQVREFEVDLADVVKLREAEVEELTRRAEALAHERQTLTRKIPAIQAEIAEMQKDNNSRLEHLRELADQRQQLDAEIAEMHRDLGAKWASLLAARNAATEMLSNAAAAAAIQQQAQTLTSASSAASPAPLSPAPVSASSAAAPSSPPVPIAPAPAPLPPQQPAQPKFQLMGRIRNAPNEQFSVFSESGRLLAQGETAEDGSVGPMLIDEEEVDIEVARARGRLVRVKAFAASASR